MTENEVTNKYIIPSDITSKLISDREWEIIQEIRHLEHGRVVIFIQDHVIINKEITKIIKTQKILDKDI